MLAIEVCKDVLAASGLSHARWHQALLEAVMCIQPHEQRYVGVHVCDHGGPIWAGLPRTWSLPYSDALSPAAPGRRALCFSRAMPCAFPEPCLVGVSILCSAHQDD